MAPHPGAARRTHPAPPVARRTTIPPALRSVLLFTLCCSALGSPALRAGRRAPKEQPPLLLQKAPPGLCREPRSAVVVVPVADVWRRPLARGELPSDRLRETQVLFGERVFIHESRGPWVYIEAVEQPTFTLHRRWEGYPGWTLGLALTDRSDLFGRLFWPEPAPDPARLAAAPERSPVAAAEQLRGVPYLWGGLSQNGVDCSGLVHLAYRQQALRVPRNAQEQWLAARPIKRAELRPAGLIFSAKKSNPTRVTHVALYRGDGEIIEAPRRGIAVRRISFLRRFGKPLDKVESGDTVRGDQVIYFGTFQGGP